MEEISHRELYDRLVLVETAVGDLTTNTAAMVSAFQAAQGAFTVLEWLAKVAKPILYLGAMVGAVYTALHGIKH